MLSYWFIAVMCVPLYRNITPTRIILSALYNLNDKGCSLLQPYTYHFIITGSKFSILFQLLQLFLCSRLIFFNDAYLTGNWVWSSVFRHILLVDSLTVSKYLDSPRLVCIPECEWAFWQSTVLSQKNIIPIKLVYVTGHKHQKAKTYPKADESE